MTRSLSAACGFALAGKRRELPHFPASEAASGWGLYDEDLTWLR
jgi:hypothetical protein